MNVEYADNFECDLKHAKSLAKITDRTEVKVAVQKLEELHDRYSKFYEGHMSGIYYASDGANVIAWEYAKGLLNLIKIQYRNYELRKESVAQLKKLCDMYNNDIILTEAYFKGLSYQFYYLSLLELEKNFAIKLAYLSPQTSDTDPLMKIRCYFERLNAEHPLNISIVSDCTEGLFYLEEKLRERDSSCICTETIEVLNALEYVCNHNE